MGCKVCSAAVGLHHPRATAAPTSRSWERAGRSQGRWQTSVSSFWRWHPAQPRGPWLGQPVPVWLGATCPLLPHAARASAHCHPSCEVLPVSLNASRPAVPCHSGRPVTALCLLLHAAWLAHRPLTIPGLRPPTTVLAACSSGVLLSPRHVGMMRQSSGTDGLCQSAVLVSTADSRCTPVRGVGSKSFEAAEGDWQLL